MDCRAKVEAYTSVDKCAVTCWYEPLRHEELEWSKRMDTSYSLELLKLVNFASNLVTSNTYLCNNRMAVKTS